MASPYRDTPPQSTGDLQDYYDTVPPAHRLSGFNPRSSFASSQEIPLVYTPANAATHGVYSQPSALSDSDLPRMPQYQNLEGSYKNQWLEKQEKSAKRSRLIVIGSLAALIGLIVVGIVVGIVVTNSNKKPSSSTSSGSGSSGPSVVNQTDPNDPSTFVKNSQLKQSFYGIAYTPYGSQLPNCGNSLSDVIQDIQLISQLTKRIRLYGADCNQTALVLEAIKQTKVNMTVFLGNYPVPTDQNAAYDRQRDLIKSALQTYGTNNIGGITVGNEFMLNYLNANGGTVPDSTIGDAGAALLIADIQDTRSMLAGLNMNIPVGTADAGSYFNTKVLEAVDYGMSNVHAWFANQSITNAASWTTQFFQQTNVDAAALLPNKPMMYIAETGWPTKSSDAGNANNGASAASIANLQTFIDTFVCQSNTGGIPYFFFEVRGR
jgi:exo-beta-1,3-glucanase (GH17 family)